MPKTLLLADDSVTIQKVVGISFASEDIAIVTVDNGRDAVAKARELRPDVILADVVMPAMSGYEVCEAIKGDPALAHIPVLLLTGTFEAFDEARAAAAGAAGHVAKPFEAQTLVERVKQMLAAAPAPRAAAPSPVASAPAPAPAGAARDADAFDFFSDEPGEAPAAGDGALGAGPLDLDEPDAAFAFGDEDLAEALQEPVRAAPLASSRADATVAMGSEPPAHRDGGASPLDFSFEADDADLLDAPLEPADLAQTTLLDPAAGSGFDISSSDLSPAPAWAPGAATPGTLHREETDAPLYRDLDLTEPEEPFDGLGEPAGAAEPAIELDTPPPVRAGAGASEPGGEPNVRPFGVASEPATGLDPERTMPRGAMTPLAAAAARPTRTAPLPPDPWPDPRTLGADHRAAGDILGPEAIEAEAFDPDALGLAPLEAAPIEAAEPLAAPGARASAGAALAPMMREEIQSALEKIAWDALGPVTEKIVQQAIERIEQVVWEVVPKLAETLIQEEIRRLKGDAGE